MHSQPVRDISILRVGWTELKLGPSTILQPSADWVILIKASAESAVFRNTRELQLLNWHTLFRFAEKFLRATVMQPNLPSSTAAIYNKTPLL